jgi:hypothetical protein
MLLTKMNRNGRGSLGAAGYLDGWSLSLGTGRDTGLMQGRLEVLGCGGLRIMICCVSSSYSSLIGSLFTNLNFYSPTD